MRINFVNFSKRYVTARQWRLRKKIPRAAKLLPRCLTNLAAQSLGPRTHPKRLSPTFEDFSRIDFLEPFQCPIQVIIRVSLIEPPSFSAQLWRNRFMFHIGFSVMGVFRGLVGNCGELVDYDWSVSWMGW